MAYRIEISPNNRAGCSATSCKKEGIKILKGEIRHAVLVPFQETQSWKYRHWGCVTPTVLHNWAEKSGLDEDLIDGFDALPEEVQEKVRRALKNEHVDDEDWNGDVEMNTYDPKNKAKGMFKKVSKKQKAEDDQEEADPDTPAKKTAGKKRGRAAKDEEDDDGAEPDNSPVAKKGRTKKAVKEENADDEPVNPPAAKKGRTKKAIKEEADDEPAVQPAAKKGRAKKAVKEEADDQPAVQPAAKKGRTKKAIKEEADDEPADPPAAKKGRAKKPVAPTADNEADEAPPVKKGRVRKAPVPVPTADEETDSEDASVKKKPAAKKTRGKKAELESSDPLGVEDEQPVVASKTKAKPAAKGKARSKKSGTSEAE